VAVCKQLE
jgi:hypothetical protein